MGEVAFVPLAVSLRQEPNEEGTWRPDETRTTTSHEKAKLELAWIPTTEKIFKNSVETLGDAIVYTVKASRALRWRAGKQSGRLFQR